MLANKTIEVTGVWCTECVPMSVSWQSGSSHYSTIQALEPYLPADKGIRSLSSGAHQSSPPIMIRLLGAAPRGIPYRSKGQSSSRWR